ncbi:hypothetical protein [Streptomyces cinereospinus]|uniref:Uncharacterized protein n=1 Tax=Streptomyces cinereospinus TaxID=285561 RepID=A0ABV5MW19_9ACTN
MHARAGRWAEHGRADRAKRLAAAATALPPARWFLDQLNALREQPTA